MSTERRQSQRANVQLPAKIRGAQGAAEISATTRDLSSNGIFLYSEAKMQPGSKFELVLMLPRELGIGPGGWTLCQASVVRVESAGEKRIGIAAKLDRIDLLPELI